MTNPIFSLSGKVVLVTGASRGLGWAMAQAMAAAGATVVLNGRDADTLRGRVRQIADSGGRADMAVFDVSQHQHTERELAKIVERHGQLDILVNNAGIQHRQALTEFSTQDFQRVIDVNLTAVWVLVREAAKIMIPRRHGRIIITGSLTAQIARPNISAYIASKGAVTALTRSLAAELGPHGITCNALAPGYIHTEMNTALVEDEKFNAWICGRTPLGRWGEPSELGGPAVFLASDAASYVNGHVLTVDGGMAAVI